MFNSESDDREEFLRLEDFADEIGLEELAMINNHPNGDEYVTKGELLKTTQNSRMDLVVEFGELLTESDENPYAQARRVKQEREAAKIFFR